MKINFDDLVERGLVVRKRLVNQESEYLTGCSLYKYHRKVMFDDLWDSDSRLLLARGTITRDDTDEVVVLPFTKTFNYAENRVAKIDPEAMVQIVRKVNGFMFCVTVVNSMSLICSTTGSTDSSFVELAREKLGDFDVRTLNPSISYLFEITDSVKDPHIVKERDGVWLIGARYLSTGEYFTENELDSIAKESRGALLRPEHMILKFKDIDLEAQHEGWMVRNMITGDLICKLKIDYYVAKKFIMRKKIGNIKAAAANPQNAHFPAQYRYIAQEIENNELYWNHIPEQSKGLIFDELKKKHDREVEIDNLRSNSKTKEI